jgi:hypothetical protein
MNLFKDLVKSKKPLSDRLFQEITDYEIYCELAGTDIEIGVPISSPLRDDDGDPSFSIFIPTEYTDVRPEEIWWRDFARGAGDVFKFVKLFADFHYNIELENRYQVIKFLDQELELGIFEGNKRERERKIIDYEAAKERKEILFQSRDYTRRDLYWWACLAVDKDLLEEHDVRSVKYLLRDDYSIRKSFRAFDLAYAIVVYDKVKLYRPESLTAKFRNTCPKDYLMGKEQCKGLKHLIITKSMKDILCFKSLMHVDAISPQGEGNNFSLDFIKWAKDVYGDEIYVVMDYDNAGIEAAEKLESHGFKIRWISTKQVQVGNKMKVPDKDLSDYITNHGILLAMDRLKHLFPEFDDSIFRDDRVDYFEELKIKLAS